MAAHMKFQKMLKSLHVLGRLSISDSVKCLGNTRVSVLLNKNYGTSSEVVVELTQSSPLRFVTGELARFADGCAVVHHGDTTVMTTVVRKNKPGNGSFLPLTVDYRQKTAAAGRIPTNHLRRDLGPSEKEILTSRMIDRSLRPRFPPGYFYETQITCNLLAVDGNHDPDIVSINAASAALCLSNIPWNGPVAAVRVGFVDEEFIINPNRKMLSKSKLNLVVTAAEHKTVVMLEGSCENLPEHIVLKAIAEGVKEVQNILKGISELQAACGKEKKPTTYLLPSEELITAAESLCVTKAQEIFLDKSHNKVSRDDALNELRKETFDKVREIFSSEDSFFINEAINLVIRKTFRDLVSDTQIRCDGRDLSSLRDITCKVDLFKPLHGSALFQRGQTQVLSTVAFDSPESVLRSDAMSVLTGAIKEKNFMLHYEFPPYATNETGRLGALSGRRELGHGALAEKAIRPVMPSDFPFTVRLTSEVLESNGSSSMATVCGGSLALMDAGVPIHCAVSGVAIGLISDPHPTHSYELKNFSILTDILGIEDYFGDMDFKLAGTKKGLTALQLDIKIPCLPVHVIHEAIKSARDAQKRILAIMNSALQNPKQEKKENWPVCEKLDLPPHKRSKFVGLGGFNLKKLSAETGVQVSSSGENSFQIFAPNETAMQEAKDIINTLLTDKKEPVLEFGAIYTAKIEEIRNAGVMVTLYPDMTPVLLHNSQLDQRKISHPSALGLEVGQEMHVKYYGRDPVSGIMRLSRKVLQMLPSSAVKSFQDSSSDVQSSR